MKGLTNKHMIPIYGRPIRICFHRETFERMVGYNLSELSIGHTFESGGVIFVYMQKSDSGSVSANTLSHEAYHIVDYLLELTGADHTHGGSNEHCAYLIGYIVDRIFDALDFDNKMEFGND